MLESGDLTVPFNLRSEGPEKFNLLSGGGRKSGGWKEIKCLRKSGGE